MHAVDVEAELGIFCSGANRNDFLDQSLYTNPELESDFISRTGANSLAVAIKNSHNVYLCRNSAFGYCVTYIAKKAAFIPLVLHVTSQIPHKQVIAAIQNGITKTNIATGLHLKSMKAFSTTFSRDYAMEIISSIRTMLSVRKLCSIS